MGAKPSSQRPWGGRWTAAYSLWTYAHRVLHELGISAVDEEEVALLSGPLVRIRCMRRRHKPVVLAHYPDPLYPDEPIGWVDPTSVPLSATLFFLHFDTSDPQRSDKARLATAAPAKTTPRAWLALDPKTGLVSLTVSELQAAVFELRVSDTAMDSAHVTLHCPCAVGRYLSVHADTKRARVCAASAAQSETFLINNMPLPPTLRTDNECRPSDCTMAMAYDAIRSSPVRIQSSYGWFLASKPGAPVTAACNRDSGWDGFSIEYDSATRSAKLRDSRGLYLTFSSQFDKLVAVPDQSSESDGLEERCLGDMSKKPESFYVHTVADDDRVVLMSRKGYLSAKRDGQVVLSKNTRHGRNEQFHLRLALPSMMDQSKPRLRLRVCPDGARQVEASVVVPAPARIAYQVLCDYDGFADFIQDATESRVLERMSDTELTVLMVQSHTFLILTIPMKMVLNVLENPEKSSVCMDLKHGLGVKQYHGKWQAVEQGDGKSLVKCSLIANSSVPAPGFLLDGLISHATIDTMEQIRKECIRRSSLERGVDTCSRNGFNAYSQSGKTVQSPVSTAQALNVS